MIELAQTTSLPHTGPLVYVSMKKHIRVVEQVEWKPEILSSPLAVQA